MYDMYPDWGPARHRQATDTTVKREQDPHLQFVQESFDQRDSDGERPDDN